MSDYHVYIPYVNRPDLLERAVRSVPELWKDLTILDNSEDGSAVDIKQFYPVEVFEPPVPLSFTQSQNFFFKYAKRRGCKFVLWLHNDCEIPAGAVQKLIEYVRNLYAEGRRWGVCFTYYDIFSAVNLEMIDEVGGYDTNIRAYKSDQEFYFRVRKAGWELINTEIEVEVIKAGHVGSQTIRSDEKLSLINGVIQTADAFYYEQKWGSDAGNEKYEFPFDRPDIFGGK